ncbi:MAG TPA: MoxR family ATPase [Bryobacteraceae bacterium]|nr:MoxR family ATPase [Bryobacteraceae bacterium]
MSPRPLEIADIDGVIRAFEARGYIPDRTLATAIYLLVKLGKPLLIEGHAGVGKTEVAKTLAAALATDLIRLQCYEGLDSSSALYEWNYQKQLLAIRIRERGDETPEEKVRHIFGPEFLLERPLLRSIRAPHSSPVLLIDEVDRADEAFEAFLLELLSDFQISIPELGTIRAQHRPYVILTSNRTRELGDALRRRCLYHWIDYPDLEKEMKIVAARAPAAGSALGKQVVEYVQSIRQMNLAKPPGVAETLDCVYALESLGKDRLDAAAAEETLGCVAKSAEDSAKIKAEGIARILSREV